MPARGWHDSELARSSLTRHPTQLCSLPRLVARSSRSACTLRARRRQSPRRPPGAPRRRASRPRRGASRIARARCRRGSRRPPDDPRARRRGAHRNATQGGGVGAGHVEGERSATRAWARPSRAPARRTRTAASRARQPRRPVAPGHGCVAAARPPTAGRTRAAARAIRRATNRRPRRARVRPGGVLGATRRTRLRSARRPELPPRARPRIDRDARAPASTPRIARDLHRITAADLRPPRRRYADARIPSGGAGPCGSSARRPARRRPRHTTTTTTTTRI